MTDETPDREALFKAAEAMKDLAATFSGMRRQFIDTGWSPKNAEEMVLTIVRGSLGAAQQQRPQFPFPFGGVR